MREDEVRDISAVDLSKGLSIQNSSDYDICAALKNAQWPGFV